MSIPTLKDWLGQGDFSLTLSSGFFSFYAHCGFIAALEEAQLFPSRISGSSAGALIGGLWASGLSALELKELLFSLKRKDFWDPKLGLGLLKGERFSNMLSSSLPVSEIEACKIPLAISTFDPISRNTKVLEGGDLNRALRASCAVPLLFSPVWISKRPLLDGGIKDRHGLLGMPEQERLLYHHIVSKSLWRNAKSPALQIPKRSDMTTVAIEDLPRINPFRLHRGPDAYHYALDGMRLALERPLTAVIRV